MTDDLHSCSLYCTRPACVLAQRNEMRDAAPPAPSTEPVNLNDSAVQKRLAAQWGYVSALSAEPVQCAKCIAFFARYRCNKPQECDCPKCQGYCDCPPDHTAAMRQALEALLRGRGQILGVLVQEDQDAAIDALRKALEEK